MTTRKKHSLLTELATIAAGAASFGLLSSILFPTNIYICIVAIFAGGILAKWLVEVDK